MSIMNDRQHDSSDDRGMPDVRCAEPRPLLAFISLTLVVTGLLLTWCNVRSSRSAMGRELAFTTFERAVGGDVASERIRREANLLHGTLKAWDKSDRITRLLSATYVFGGTLFAALIFVRCMRDRTGE